jgi:hypothetical protein
MKRERRNRTFILAFFLSERCSNDLADTCCHVQRFVSSCGFTLCMNRQMLLDAWSDTASIRQELLRSEAVSKSLSGFCVAGMARAEFESGALTAVVIH